MLPKGVLSFHWLVLIPGLVFTSCKDEGTTPQSSSIEMHLLSSTLFADFRTPTTPDEDGTRCSLTVVVKYIGSNEPVNGTIPSVRVYRVSGNHLVGTILLQTFWDGILTPGEADTVRLIKTSRQGPTLVPAPCGEQVTLSLQLLRVSDGGALAVVRRDSLLFECFQ